MQHPTSAKLENGNSRTTEPNPEIASTLAKPEIDSLRVTTPNPALAPTRKEVPDGNGRCHGAGVRRGRWAYGHADDSERHSQGHHQPSFLVIFLLDGDPRQLDSSALPSEAYSPAHKRQPAKRRTHEVKGHDENGTEREPRPRRCDVRALMARYEGQTRVPLHKRQNAYTDWHRFQL